MLHRFIALLSLCLLPWLALADDTWQNPKIGQKYDFSGDKLEKAWPILTRGAGIPWPSAKAVKDGLEKYPAVKAITPIHGEDYEAYAQQVQEAFRRLFEGDLKGAKKLGMSLGPIGYVPAMYAQNYYALHGAKSLDEKQALLKEAIKINEEGLKIYPELEFARFGVNYAKSRYTEDLNQARALATGYIGDMRKGLEKLVAANPRHTFSVATLGGIHAGIIDKAGAFSAKLVMGATSEKVEQYFEEALRQQPELIVVRKEYAVSLLRTYGDEAKPKAIQSLQTAIGITPKHALESMEQQQARRLLNQLNS